MKLAATVAAGLLAVLAATSAPAQEAPAKVYAASSLTEVVSELADRFARDSGRPRPAIVFAGSSRLAHQIEAGAPADVVLTADEAWMAVLAAGGHLVAGSRRVLVANRLVVAVPRGASFVPEHAAHLADVRVRRLAVAGEPVPAGRRAREALAHHGQLAALEPRLVRCTSVRAALALVANGEVDAGIVYATDTRASADVQLAFEFAAAAHREIRYPVALTSRAAGNPSARAFYDFLASAEAQRVFRAAGFVAVAVGVVDEDGGAPLRRTVPGEAAPAQAVSWIDPLLRSAWVATLSLMLSIGPALLLGWVLARKRFRGKAIVSTLLLSPLVLPPVVTGYLLLWVFGRNGPLGVLLEGIGVSVAFTRWGAVVAAGVVGFPLLLIMTRNAIESVDPRYEQLAATLGMHPVRAFVKVTLPMAMPGVLAGCVLAFARALGEFGATAMLASDVPGETRTLALAVYALYEQPGGTGAAGVLVGVSLALCLLALLGYERLSAAQARRLGGAAE